MSENHHEHFEKAAVRREALINLNKLEVLLGCAVAIIGLVGCLGSWYVLPYRLSQVELEQKAAAAKLEVTQHETQQKIESIQRNADANKELLIRIDERLRQVQIALKIPTQTP